MGNIFSIFKKKEKAEKSKGKLSKFKKFQIAFNKKKESFLKYNKTNKDFISFKSDIFEIIVTGLFAMIGLSLFGFDFKLIYIIGTGSIWFLLSKKILPELKSLIGSFSLIRITR
jgi:hypothetical protein